MSAPYRGVALDVLLFAWDHMADNEKTADSANITANVRTDSGAFGSAKTVTEIGSGLYSITLTAAEMDGDCVYISAVSSTAFVEVTPRPAMLYPNPVGLRGAVASVIDSLTFTITLERGLSSAIDQYREARIYFITGDNLGVAREILTYDGTNEIVIEQDLPGGLPAVGNQFLILPETRKLVQYTADLKVHFDATNGDNYTAIWRADENPIVNGVGTTTITVRKLSTGAVAFTDTAAVGANDGIYEWTTLAAETIAVGDAAIVVVNALVNNITIEYSTVIFNMPGGTGGGVSWEDASVDHRVAGTMGRRIHVY